MMRKLALLGVLFMCQTTAWAHKASDSYLVVDVKGKAITAQWDIALRDVDFALGLDGDGNAEITWGELRSRQRDVSAWALSRLELTRSGTCPLQVTGLQVDDHTDGGYAVLHLAGTCPGATGHLALQYRLLFDLDKLHRGLLRLTLDGTAYSSVLSPTNDTVKLGGAQASHWDQFKRFLVEGVWHIWIGFDHILFLLSLLLPAVLVLKMHRWQGVSSFGLAAREVLWVVTSFTAAHSMTLSLAALGMVSLPSRLVESAIALSVVLTAANNLWPLVNHRRWLLAFGFGLIHGFGFASVLAELGLPADALVLSLLGFNVGVEVGQMVIVALFLPVAFWLRNTGFYLRGLFVLGSWLTLLVAMVWLLERVFDLKLMSG
jgi:hypothetical protein